MRIFLPLILMLFSLAACADDKAGSPVFKEGEHYQRLDTPVRTRDSDRIEVTEVFWYGCGHCFMFEPIVHGWSKKLPQDVVFERSPAMWNKTMEVHARAFYVARSLNILDKIHQPLFDALNLQKKQLATPVELADFFAAYGVDKDTFMKTYESFGVASQVKQADARARSYGIKGTPELIVDGTYRISARMAGGQTEMLKVADFLIAKIRAERS